MRLLPRSLLGRNLLLFAVLITCALGASALVFYRFVTVPRTEATIAYTIELAQALALAVESGAEPSALPGPARVLAAGEAPPEFVTPSKRTVQITLEKIGQRLPQRYSLGWQEDASKLWIGVPIADQKRWVSFPVAGMVAPLRTVLIAWVLSIGILATAGAWLIERRIERPLRAIVTAAREVGAGRTAPLISEDGPIETAQVAQAFNAMALDLDRMDRERAVMLAGVSHDLRSPLTKIRLALEMMSPATDPSLRASIERSVDSANRVIDQFVDFGRGAQEEPFQACDLNAVVRAFAQEHTQGDLILEPGTLPNLRLRSNAMHRLLANLVDNALKYAGRPVTIRTQLVDGAVLLRIVDHGPGIAPEDVARMRKPFVRSSQSRAETSGAGLGLAIVDRIASAHDARLDLLPVLADCVRPGLEARITFDRKSIVASAPRDLD